MHVLVTPRLTLRQPAFPDADDIALWLSNWNVARMLGPVPHPYHHDNAVEWIAAVSGKPGALVYTIHRERLIGVVSLEGDEAEPRLGYWLAEPWHRRGFMTEAARALLAHAFSTRGIDAVQSYVFTDNDVSLHTQEKLGFAVTGKGEAWSRSRGARVDTWTTRLTASKFSGLSDADKRTAA